MRLRMSKDQEKWLKDFLKESPLHAIVLAAITSETDDLGIVYTPAHALAEKTGAPPIAVFDIFKALAKQKFGTWKMGRRKHPTRIVWAVQPSDISRMARGTMNATINLAPKKGLEEFTFTSGRTAWMPKKITADELKDLYAWVGQQLLG